MVWNVVRLYGEQYILEMIKSQKFSFTEMCPHIDWLTEIDCTDFRIESEGIGTLKIFFCTHITPPLGVYRFLATEYPSLWIIAKSKTSDYGNTIMTRFVADFDDSENRRIQSIEWKEPEFLDELYSEIPCDEELQWDIERMGSRRTA